MSLTREWIWSKWKVLFCEEKPRLFLSPLNPNPLYLHFRFICVVPTSGSGRWKSHNGQSDEGGCWRARLFNDNQRSQRDAQGQEDQEPEKDGTAAPQQEDGRTRPGIQSVNFDLILTPFSIISHYNKRWPRLLLVYSLAEEDTFEVKKHIQRMASATCASPAVRLVYVRQQHEAAANVRYLPACTWVSRCSDEIGCCADDSKICSASHVETVSLPFFVSPSSSSCGLVRHNSRRRRRSPKKANRDRDKNPFFSPCPVLSSAAPGTRSDPDRSPLYSSFPFLFVLLVFHQSHSWQILELPKVNAGLRSPFFSFYCSDSLPVSPSRLGLVIYPTTVIVGADRDGNGDQEDGDETDFRESHGLRMRRTEQRLNAQDGAWTARVRAPSIISESNESPGWGRREEKNDRAASSSPADWKVVVARRR